MHRHRPRNRKERRADNTADRTYHTRIMAQLAHLPAVIPPPPPLPGTADREADAVRRILLFQRVIEFGRPAEAEQQLFGESETNSSTWSQWLLDIPRTLRFQLSAYVRDPTKATADGGAESDADAADERRAAAAAAATDAAVSEGAAARKAKAAAAAAADNAKAPPSGVTSATVAETVWAGGDANTKAAAAARRGSGTRRAFDGIVEIVQNHKGFGELGSRVWDSALVLSRYIEAQSPSGVELRGKTVIEIGAGTGLPSIVAALSRADAVYVTDKAALLPLISHNVLQNVAHDPALHRRVIVRELLWGCHSNPLAPVRFDYVIGADLTYDFEDLPILCTTLCSLCTPHGTKTETGAEAPETTVLIGYGVERAATETFLQTAAQHFVVANAPKHHLITTDIHCPSYTPAIAILKRKPGHSCAVTHAHAKAKTKADAKAGAAPASADAKAVAPAVAGAAAAAAAK